MMTIWKPAAIAAGVLLSGCQAPPQASDGTGSPESGPREPTSEPTKVTPAPDPEAESGPAVPRDQAVPGGPPPAKGGY